MRSATKISAPAPPILDRNLGFPVSHTDSHDSP